MKKSLVIMEFNSIGTAFYTLDRITKNFLVDIRVSRLLCPGRYLLAFRVDMGDGREILNFIEEVERKKGTKITSKLIGALEEEVIARINSPAFDVESVKNIGVVEVKKTSTSLEMGDLLYKGANLQIMCIRIGSFMGGKSVIIVSGGVQDISSSFLLLEEKYGREIISSEIISAPEKIFLENIGF